MSTPRVGQLLVASRQLLDPNFVRTVVLIVQQDDGGVIGLILNRPLELTVAQACEPSAEEVADVDEKLSQGGPCPGPLMVLHSNQLVGGEAVIDGVRFTTEREDIRSLMDGSGAGGRVRYFAGYSGWSPDQLENEIGQGAWLLAPASSDDVFGEVSPQALWAKLTTRLTIGKWVDVERMPDDPSVN